MSASDAPRKEAVVCAFLRALVMVTGMRAFDAMAMHRAFNSITRTLRSMHRSQAPELWMLRFSFNPDLGRYEELDEELEDLKRDNIVSIEWDGASEVIAFNTKRFLKRAEKLCTMSTTSSMLLEHLCKQAVGVYKSLSRSCCD